MIPTASFPFPSWNPLRRPIDALARAAFLKLMGRIRAGRLRVEEPRGATVLGSGSELEATLRVYHPGFYRAALLEGSVGVGRGYMEGWWGSDDLVGLIRLLARDRELLSRWGARTEGLRRPLHRLRLWARRNSLRGSRRNIRAHYDLGEDFFSVFLDRRLMYSCAFFAEGKDDLERASEAKLEKVCQKLELGPEDHVLEIGSGWGGFALHAARRYGCRVTTTTISERQFRHARRRVAEEGLGDRVEVLLRDYRELRGEYDKLVSIEMIEAVGPDHLDGYLRRCGELLRPGGRMLLQAIVIEDGEYERAARSEDFIKRYIFPGGFLPSVEAIRHGLARGSRLSLQHREDLTEHYALTLAHWRRRLLGGARRLLQLGFDESFLRRWEFYFAYCEGGFRERRIGNVQLLLAHEPPSLFSPPDRRLPA